MGERNRFGLGRTISAEVKREVRRRCGFGCVRCGLGFYDYEHFAPDFKDATKHDASGITLLCMQCNQKRARGQLSVETVAQANSYPRCLQDGFAREDWGFGHDPIEVIFAGVTFVDVINIVLVNDYPILSILPPEDGSNFYRLSAIFSDSHGQTTLQIHENEWRAGAENWDVESKGHRLTIRSGPRDISLVLRSDPPHRIVVEKLNMEFDGIMLKGNEKVLEFSLNRGLSWGSLKATNFVGCLNGLCISNSSRRREELGAIRHP